MIGNEAALGVIYSGEAIYTQKENPNLEYVIPKEGSNIWIDSWVIPKNAEHKENAEKFINFLCRPDIALMNFEYITLFQRSPYTWSASVPRYWNVSRLSYLERSGNAISGIK